MSALRVLHVEDDFADALLVQNTVFESGDFEIGFEVARDLQDAKRKLHARDYDLVLLDLRLPDSVNPEDTLNTMQSLCPDTPIVVLSGSVRVDRYTLPKDIQLLDKNEHLTGRKSDATRPLAQILRISAANDDFARI
ncbi:response regulator [Hyphobacterium sp.]|jgi:DNA-binding NtrC family response regulator|uniref:response regulator n=1 Tax=Hyphobacterium sp. TaxID=2004662 RepID=UPI003BAC7CED